MVRRIWAGQGAPAAGRDLRQRENNFAVTVPQERLKVWRLPGHDAFPEILATHTKLRAKFLTSVVARFSMPGGQG
jgi:hypothetical protein